MCQCVVSFLVHFITVRLVNNGHLKQLASSLRLGHNSTSTFHCPSVTWPALVKQLGAAVQVTGRIAQVPQAML